MCILGTTPLVNVNLNVSRCETLTVNCSYPLLPSPPFSPDSPLLGCGITLSNSTATINKVVFIHNNNDKLLMLSAGSYTILSFACYNEECTSNVSVCLDYERMITISKCHTSKLVNIRYQMLWAYYTLVAIYYPALHCSLCTVPSTPLLKYACTVG